MIQPYRGKIYDPCCGSGGMFVQSMKFIEAHHGNKKDISVYGQEYTNTTYKQAKMNLTIRGIACNLGEKAADTFHDWQCEGYECSEDRETQLEVRINQDTVWLNAYQIAELFGRDSKIIRKHIANAIKASNPQPIGFRGILLVKRQKFFYCTYSLGITETS